MDCEPFHVEVGEFLYPQGYARYRPLPFSIRDATVVITVMEGLAYRTLEELLSEFPSDFHELTQCVCRDLWNSVKHLSVPVEDIWVRIGRGLELGSTHFRDAVLQDDVVITFVISTGGRVDLPVIESSIHSAASSGSTLKLSSLFIQRKLRKPSHFALGLSHTQMIKGANLKENDAEFFSSLKFATMSREVDTFFNPSANNLPHHHSYQQQQSMMTGGTSNMSILNTNAWAPKRVPVVIRVHMDDIRAYLAPPPPKPEPPQPVQPQRFAYRDSPMTPVHSPPMVVSSASAQPTVAYRPLTPTRRRDSGNASESRHQRLFIPRRVSAEVTPYRGSRSAIQASIEYDNPSAVSSDTEEDDGAWSDVVHVTNRSHQSFYQHQPNSGGGGVIAPRDLRRVSDATAPVSHDEHTSSYSHQYASSTPPLATAPPRSAGDLSVQHASSMSHGGGGGARIVRAPTVYPSYSSEIRWEERQAHAPPEINNQQQR